MTRLITQLNQIKERQGTEAALRWLRTLTQDEIRELSKQNIVDFIVFCEAVERTQMQKFGLS